MIQLPALAFDGAVSKQEARTTIREFEARLKEMPQVDLPLVHRFAPGMYAREIFIPKDTVAVGKIHKYPAINIISQGDVAVLTEDGANRFRAPFSFVSTPLAKRVVYAYEDTVWTTVHATNETDLARLEEELILPDFPVEPEPLSLKGTSI